MSKYQFEIPIDRVNLDTLRTEEDFRSEAQRLLPTILAQIYGDEAGAAFDKAKATYESMGGMAGSLSAEEETQFRADTAKGLRDRAIDPAILEIEDEIVRQLKATKQKGKK